MSNKSIYGFLKVLLVSLFFSALLLYVLAFNTNKAGATEVQNRTSTNIGKICVLPAGSKLYEKPEGNDSVRRNPFLSLGMNTSLSVTNEILKYPGWSYLEVSKYLNGAMVVGWVSSKDCRPLKAGE